MIGDPAQFEALGSRLGFRAISATPDKLVLCWQGPRFPALLCLGIAVILLLVSVPIVEALRLRGFVGPAGSLWYFPVMNLILFAIALFLITQRRTIEVDSVARTVTLRRQSLYRTVVLAARFDEVIKLRLAADQVYSGFAIAGSTAAQTFPVPALRLVLADGSDVLLDRGSVRRITELGGLISERTAKPLDIEPQPSKSLRPLGVDLGSR